jgi:phosphoglycerate kinase
MGSFATLDQFADRFVDASVLVRLDLNSPIEDGTVQDNRRFERHARTVAELAAAGHRVICLAHQGRPGRDDFTHLDQHADLLSTHLDRQVEFVEDVHGDAAVATIEDAEPGDVVLLDNVRMAEDELADREPVEHGESELVTRLAAPADAYINDAYSAAHRGHASLVGFPYVLPAYAGRVMETEYEANSAIARRSFDGKVTMVLGGTKATDVVGVMDAIGDKVDRFCLGGIVGELFLRARGNPVGVDLPGEGTALFGEQWDRNEETIRSMLGERSDQIQLPVDLAYEGEDGERAEVDVETVDEKITPFPDVGTQTVRNYREEIVDSEAVFVKGALGLFEDERFSHGTVGVLEAIAETDCFSVVGGGDTSRAIGMYWLDEESFSHVSIAGGAYIKALTGEPLVAIEALRANVPA